MTQLEVDVARAGIVRITHEEVHEPDDRRLVREIAHVGRALIVG
jgi:hypothetical protein